MEEHLDELEDDASEENVSVDSFEDDQVIIFFYAPNFKEVKGAYCFFFGLFVHQPVHPLHLYTVRNVRARILKFLCSCHNEECWKEHIVLTLSVRPSLRWH